MVFNDTKVIPARIHFQKPSGAIIEVFLLNPVLPTVLVNEAMLITDTCVWQCMIGNKKRWKNGEVLSWKSEIDNELTINAELVDNELNYVKFWWEDKSNSGKTFLEIIQQLGQIPLPPYLKRKTETKDLETYQTVYSKAEGAVAAPTAGLHFTEEVLKNLADKNIQHDFATLHVGAGTFQPVKVENVVEHQMHSEQIVFTKSLILNLIENLGKTIAVGTTSMRSLESLYWLGVKCKMSNSPFELNIEKLFPYQTQDLPSPKESLLAIINYMETRQIEQLVAETQIFILPGYDFKICNGLITNYHQPESTLMLLVAAFVGSDWKRIYDEALKKDYRFLSYGDSSLLLR